VNAECGQPWLGEANILNAVELSPCASVCKIPTITGIAPTQVSSIQHDNDFYPYLETYKISQ